MQVWTPEETATALKGWYEGLSASQIGRQLKRSRNAVIGKLHRIRAPKRAAPHISPKPRNPHGRRGHPRRAFESFNAPTIKPTPAKPLQGDLDAIAALLPVDPTMTVLRLSTMTCRYPIGDPKEGGFAFCGRTCTRVYCADHCRLTYRPAESRKRRKPDELRRLERMAAGRAM